MRSTIERANSSTQTSPLDLEEILSNMILRPDIQLDRHNLEDVELPTTELERDNHGNIIPKTPDVTDEETEPLSDRASRHHEPARAIWSMYRHATKCLNAETRSNQPHGSSPEGDRSRLNDAKTSTSNDAPFSWQTTVRRQQDGSCPRPRIAEHPNIRFESNTQLIRETHISEKPTLHPSSKSTRALFLAPLTNASIKSQLQLCTRSLRCNERRIVRSTYPMSGYFSTPDISGFSLNVS